MLEIFDIAGDIIYLTLSPHIDEFVVMILSFTLFLPFSIMLAINMFDKKTDAMPAFWKTLSLHFGYGAFNGEQDQNTDYH